MHNFIQSDGGLNMMRMIAIVLLCVLMGGCVAYYRVIDPSSGREYYTNNWDAGRYSYTGAARFIDARTGREITLASTEVEKISKEDYEYARAMRSQP